MYLRVRAQVCVVMYNYLLCSYSHRVPTPNSIISADMDNTISERGSDFGAPASVKVGAVGLSGLSVIDSTSIMTNVTRSKVRILSENLIVHLLKLFDFDWFLNTRS